jgi:hypothetical protein
MMSKLFAGEKGWSMAKTNEVIYKDVLRLFWGFLFVALIFCDGSSVCADDGKGSNKSELAWRYVSEGLLFYNELVTESGRDFVKARKVHADLLSMYVQAREADYVTALLTDEAAAGILKSLKSIKESLEKAVPPEGKQDPNAWAEKDIKDASKRVGELLRKFEPYLKEPFDLDGDGFEKLGDRCRNDLDVALKDVKVKLAAYINDLTTEKTDDLTIEKAVKLCEANRRAIVLLFMARFVRFEDHGVNAETSGKGLDLKVLRQFRGDINRTIYWNRVLQKRLKGSDKSVLKEYSASELRRLRVLRAVLNKDMREAQALLLFEFKASFPLKTTSGIN